MFTTGFLVLMGIGEFIQDGRFLVGYLLVVPVLMVRPSSPGGVMSLRSHPNPGNDHEYCRGSTHLRHHNQFHHVLPRARRVLSFGLILMNGGESMYCINLCIFQIIDLATFRSIVFPMSRLAANFAEMGHAPDLMLS